MFVSLVTILVILNMFNLGHVKSKDICPESRKKQVDECAMKTFFLMDPNFDSSLREKHDEYCSNIDKGIKCVEKYGKECLKGFDGQSLTIANHGTRKLYKSICGKNAPKREEFLKKTEWIKKDKIDELYTCASAGIKNLNIISKSVKNDEQIPQACCNYWLARKCFDGKLQKLTSATNKDFINKLANESLSNLINFLCAKQNSLNVCNNLMPNEINRMESIYKSTKVGQREQFESFLIPFLNVISE